MAAPVHDSAPGEIVVFNIFTVEKGKQDEFIAYMKTVRPPPKGCLSVEFSASLDGTKVINRARWSNIEDFNNRFNSAQGQGVLARWKELGVTHIDQLPYKVVEPELFF